MTRLTWKTKAHADGGWVGGGGGWDGGMRVMTQYVITLPMCCFCRHWRKIGNIILKRALVILSVFAIATVSSSCFITAVSTRGIQECKISDTYFQYVNVTSDPRKVRGQRSAGDVPETYS